MTHTEQVDLLAKEIMKRTGATAEQARRSAIDIIGHYNDVRKPATPATNDPPTSVGERRDLDHAD